MARQAATPLNSFWSKSPRESGLSPESSARCFSAAAAPEPWSRAAPQAYYESSKLSCKLPKLGGRTWFQRLLTGVRYLVVGGGDLTSLGMRCRSASAPKEHVQGCEGVLLPPSTQHSRTLVQKTKPSTVFWTRVLQYWVLRPSG